MLHAYGAQKSSWMTADKFLDWYINIFNLEVQKYREHEEKLTGKGVVIN